MNQAAVGTKDAILACRKNEYSYLAKVFEGEGAVTPKGQKNFNLGQGQQASASKGAVNPILNSV